MEEISYKRVVAGGLFALFAALMFVALAVFGVISMTLGHIFIALAALVGAAIIWLEVIPSNPTNHKIIGILILWLALWGADFSIVRYKARQNVSEIPMKSVAINQPILQNPSFSASQPALLSKKPETRIRHHVVENLSESIPILSVEQVAISPFSKGGDMVELSVTIKTNSHIPIPVEVTSFHFEGSLFPGGSPMQQKVEDFLWRGVDTSKAVFNATLYDLPNQALTVRTEGLDQDVVDEIFAGKQAVYFAMEVRDKKGHLLLEYCAYKDKPLIPIVRMCQTRVKPQ
jgi:hypothetical protein